MAEDDDEPKLSIEAYKALQEFLQERGYEEENSAPSENWQLSQFWYDDATTSTLSEAALAVCGQKSNIALISCPTLYPQIKSKIKNNSNIQLLLFEYDTRFSKFHPDYVFYDYNKPVNVDSKYTSYFDVILIDPPFLSEECLSKVTETVEMIKKEDSKIVLCTGAVMEDLATKLLNVKKCSFEPKHRSNLGNKFICMTNFGELSCE